LKGRRRSGVLVPLFSVPSHQSWGIGEFPDLAVLARWIGLAGQSFVQLLPLGEMPPGERSPYSSMTAMALDWIFIAVPKVVDFEAIGGEIALAPADRRLLATVRRSPILAYGDIRGLKYRCLRVAWDRFLRLEVAKDTPRARRFAAFVRDQSWWLDEYARFRALSAEFGGLAWWDWPAPIGSCEPAAVERERRALEGEIEFWKYLQWIAAEQWAEARHLATPVGVFGDLPFMVSANSPDVWARQGEFLMGATVGAPPDAFSATGQDWGLPPWRWDVMAESGFAWIRARARRSADIYDGFRLDHLVGLYRTFVRPKDPGREPFFAPDDEPTQTRLGETLVGIYQESGAEITAEDLGTVPAFVRDSLDRLDVPGYKVLRWERRWDVPGHPFIDPSDYPENAVATPGTHDSEPLAAWWSAISSEERAALLALPTMARSRSKPARRSSGEAFTPAVRDAMVQALLASPSRLVILPIQDVFGWSDRINTPATVDEANWSYRLPWAVEALTERHEPLKRAKRLRDWTHAAQRR
jgi:4-alpha-glucanotransferase